MGSVWLKVKPAPSWVNPQTSFQAHPGRSIVGVPGKDENKSLPPEGQN